MKIKLHLMLILMFVLNVELFAQSTPTGVWVDQSYNPDVPNIAGNPLKGMMPFSHTGTSTSFPMSMEWFYLPLRPIQTGYNTFNWASIDAQLQAISSRGHQAAFRIYLDYPGEQPGTPRFLIDAGVAMRSYSDYGNSTSLAPDWNNANLITALTNFIVALGARYDGDPRMAYVTAGLYGFWGEWHTYPYDGFTNASNWQMTEANRNKLLNAYNTAFTKTEVVLRDPLGTSDPVLKNSVGYHDDSFAYETLSPDWAFWPKVTQNGLTEIWRTHSIGGELRPEIQSTVWNSWPNTVGEDMTTSINTTHISWFINHWIYSTTPTATQYANAIRAVKMMGYTFYVSQVKLNSAASGNINVDVNIQNRGIAPIAYNWPVEMAMLNTATQAFTTLGTANWNLTALQPSTTNSLRSFSSSQALATGNYKLMMRVVHPLSNGNPLRFANQFQDADRSGWLTLGSVNVGTSTNQPPVVSITSPASGSSFAAPANITINANASDSDGAVSSVSFYNGSTLLGTDNTSPYSLSWSNVAAGTYTLTARATDNGGLTTTSSAVNVTVAGTPTGVATFYKDCNYAGASVALPLGTYTLSQLNARGILNDDVSSVRVTSGYKVTLYWDDNFAGTSLVLTADMACNGTWNDKTSSVKVETNAAAFSTVIQAEAYSSMLGVQLETTTDAGAGQNVGWIDAGDWMAYNITIPTAGTYRVIYRVASPNAAKTLRVEKDNGATILGTVTIPNTGGWQSWTNVAHNVTLPAGTYPIGLATATGGFNINYFTITSNLSARTIEAGEALNDGVTFAYPNPANTSISFAGVGKVRNVTIINLAGQQVMSVENPGDSVDVQPLNRGLHVAVVRAETGVHHFRFEKK